MLLGSLIIITLISAFIYYARHKPNHRRSHKQLRKCHKNANKIHSQHPFHCVETHSSKNACSSIKKLQGTRFLSAEAPVLPLPDCNEAHCHCDYIHHEDRRTYTRRTELGIQHDMYGQNGELERRGNGRRKED